MCCFPDMFFLVRVFDCVFLLFFLCFECVLCFGVPVCFVFVFCVCLLFSKNGFDLLVVCLWLLVYSRVVVFLFFVRAVVYVFVVCCFVYTHVLCAVFVDVAPLFLSSFGFCYACVFCIFGIACVLKDVLFVCVFFVCYVFVFFVCFPVVFVCGLFRFFF